MTVSLFMTTSHLYQLCETSLILHFLPYRHTVYYPQENIQIINGTISQLCKV